MRLVGLLVVASRSAFVFRNVLVVQLPKFFQRNEFVACPGRTLLPVPDAKGTRRLRVVNGCQDVLRMSYQTGNGNNLQARAGRRLVF